MYFCVYLSSEECGGVTYLAGNCELIPDVVVLLGAFFYFVFLFANNVSSIVCIVSNFIFTP
jgi:hypothetical protein